jgi:hypothetical protein
MIVTTWYFGFGSSLLCLALLAISIIISAGSAELESPLNLVCLPAWCIHRALHPFLSAQTLVTARIPFLGNLHAVG